MATTLINESAFTIKLSYQKPMSTLTRPLQYDILPKEQETSATELRRRHLGCSEVFVTKRGQLKLA